MIILYIPFPTKKEAKHVAKALIEKKLIACANILESASIYRWKGKVEDEKEFLLLAKTTAEQADAVEQAVKELHSYDLPAILRIPMSANVEYEQWLRDQFL